MYKVHNVHKRCTSKRMFLNDDRPHQWTCKRCFKKHIKPGQTWSGGGIPSKPFEINIHSIGRNAVFAIDKSHGRPGLTAYPNRVFFDIFKPANPYK